MAAVLALLLGGLHIWLGFGFIRSAAPTFDEPVHLASGYSYLKTGQYRLNVMDHPPFAEMWAALAILPLSPHLFLQHPDWVGARVFHYGNLFLYRNRVSAETLLNRARAFNYLTLSAALAALLIAWGWRLAGPWGAAGAAFVQTFSPALLSNFALVTTDGAPAMLFFAACFFAFEACRRDDGMPLPPAGANDARRMAREGSVNARVAMRWWLACGGAVGLALASKFSMIVLPPLIFSLAAMSAMRALPRRRPSEGLWLMLAAAAVTLAAVYRFTHVPIWWEGLDATLKRLEQGRPSFFFGDRSITGSPFYFPVALAIKTPIACLALAAVGAAGLARIPSRQRLWLWVPPVAYFAVAMTAKVQIGYRHVLPLVPFMILYAGLGLAWLKERGTSGRIAALALAAALAVSVIRVHPHQLAFFNQLVGGPERGYRCLVDSNLDWGQGLKLLAEELKRRGNPAVYLSYFGTPEPEAYGLRYFPVGIYSLLERPGNEPDPSASGKVLLAISATNLQGVYYKDQNAFDWLHTRTPVAVAGYSIFLYDLTTDPEGRRRLAAFVPPEAGSRLR